MLREPASTATAAASTMLKSCSTNFTPALADRYNNQAAGPVGPHAALLIDELGYLTIKPEQANAFFRLMDQRYSRVSAIITTNLDTLPDW